MRTRQLCKDKLEEEMIEHKHLLPNHNERLKELTLTRHKNTSPLYATVPKAEYDALKKKLDICQKECIRIAELYQRDKQLFNSKIQRIIRHIEDFKRGSK
jgi:hypothetical protein